MRFGLDLIEAACIILQLVTAGFGLYQIVLSFFGLRYRTKAIQSEPDKRFAILVAAHNEERVIRPLLKNLKELDYPRSKYDVFVIADNCTDATAEVARREGALVAERFSQRERGKGFAIRWMLDRLAGYPKSYDAVVMFDADNLVSRNFLQVMNDKLLSGKQVIQGYLDSKNPFDSWVTVSMAISYWYTNRMWQLARANLGLPCALGGTGLCIDMRLIQELGWDATSLAEDTEFGARCVAAGVYPDWAQEAKVFDEKPITLRASLRQRLRWMRGHFRCSERYFGTLVSQGVRERKLAKLDAALYLFQPSSFLIIFATGLFLLWQSSSPAVSDLTSLVPAWLWMDVNLLVVFQMALAMVMDRVNWRGMLGLPLFPFFMMTWIPVIVAAFFTRNNTEWQHTVHTRAIQYHELHRQ